MDNGNGERKPLANAKRKLKGPLIEVRTKAELGDEFVNATGSDVVA